MVVVVDGDNMMIVIMTIIMMMVMMTMVMMVMLVIVHFNVFYCMLGIVLRFLSKVPQLIAQYYVCSAWGAKTMLCNSISHSRNV